MFAKIVKTLNFSNTNQLSIPGGCDYVEIITGIAVSTSGDLSSPLVTHTICYKGNSATMYTRGSINGAQANSSYFNVKLSEDGSTLSISMVNSYVYNAAVIAYKYQS